MTLTPRLQQLIQSFQVDTGPWHKRNYHTICSPLQPNPELQDHSGLCGSSLIPAPTRAMLPVTQRCDLPSKGIQRLQEPIHLKPTQLPLTVEMLGHMLQRLETAPLKRHDRRMLRAALTLGFFGFLRVSEITLKNRRFDPRYHPTRQDISWTGEGMHLTPPSALGVPRAGTRVQWQQWRPIEDVVAVPFSHHPPSTSVMGGRLHPRASAPPSYPWWSDVATIQPNTTHTVYVLVQPQQPPEQAFPLRPSRSLADGEVLHIRPTPVIP